MFRRWKLGVWQVALAVVALCAPVRAENEGLDDLDRATQLKVTVEGLEDLNGVIDSIDSALEKGLDQGNTEFAEQLLVSSLLQRATTLSAAILNAPVHDPRRDPRWIQIRQFALTDLQRVLEIDDKSWDAYLLIGRLQSMPLGDPTAARRALSKVVDAAADEVTPEQQSQALALRGGVQRDVEKRLQDFDRAIELQPVNPEYLRLRAQHLYGKEEFEKALADIDRALELEPEHAGTHELRGMVLLGLKRQDEALASFDRATELVPEAALPYQHRGELYRQKGDLNKALEQLTKALDLAPNNVPTLLVRAGVHFELKQFDKALEDVEQAIRAQPQIAIAHLMRAEILAATDHLDQAIKHLEEITQLAPGQAQILGPLGTYYLIDNRPRKAIEVFDQAIELNPEDARSLRFRGDAYLNIGKHQEAAADFARAVELDGENEGLLNNYAWVLATSPLDEVRDGKKAVELAVQACELTGYQTPHILSTLAAATAEIGDFDSAIKWSQKAVEEHQKSIDLEQDEAAREKLQAEHKQLQAELTSYQEKKPWRETQSAEEASETPADTTPADTTEADTVDP